MSEIQTRKTKTNKKANHCSKAKRGLSKPSLLWVQLFSPCARQVVESTRRMKYTKTVL